MLALALAAALPPPAQRKAMEACVEAAIAARHPGMGMRDVTGTRYAWTWISKGRRDWTIVGSIIEPLGGREVAHRFTCRTGGGRQTTMRFGR